MAHMYLANSADKKLNEATFSVQNYVHATAFVTAPRLYIITAM